MKKKLDCLHLDFDENEFLRVYDGALSALQDPKHMILQCCS